MPYTFGASRADDANYSMGFSMLGSNSTSIVTGWWNPTNIAGTDVLWSAGDFTSIQIASPTQINLTSQNATTNGVWQGTFSTLSNGVWAYLGFAAAFSNTGPVGAVRMWQGTQDTAPVEVTVTQLTAPVGAFTGSQAFTIGNKGTSAVDSFEGDIANVVFMFCSTFLSNVPEMVLSGGVITQAEADNFGKLFVVPCWLGDYAKITETGRGVANAVQPRALFDLNNGNIAGTGRIVAGAFDALLTVNGATASVVNGNPRPALSRPSWPLRRR